jgi:hypothetical protein
MGAIEKQLSCKSKKVRKRTSQDENEVSKKKIKLNDAAKEEAEHTSDNTSEENIDLEGNNSKDAISNDRQDELNGKSLRTLLSSSDGLDALKKFVIICKNTEQKDLAAEYLFAGGNIVEVLKLLDSSDKKNTANAVTVFSAINILLMRYSC